MSYLQVQLRKAITPVFDLCRFLQTLALSTFGPLYHQKGAFSLEVLSSLKAWSYRMSCNNGSPVQEEAEPISSPSKLFYMKQTVSNACGTVALLHCVANAHRWDAPVR